MARRSRFPQLLRRRMDALGHSQQEAADWLNQRARELGVTGPHATTSQPAVNNMLAGRAKPHRCKWQAVADYLAVTVDDVERALDPDTPFPSSRIPADIGARIKRARIDTDLDRSDFEAISARRLGARQRITAGTLAAYEDGFRTPDARRIAQIAGVLGVDIDQLLRTEVLA